MFAIFNFVHESVHMYVHENISFCGFNFQATYLPQKLNAMKITDYTVYETK